MCPRAEADRCVDFVSDGQQCVKNKEISLQQVIYILLYNSYLQYHINRIDTFIYTATIQTLV